MDEMDFSGLDMPEKEKKILQAAIHVFSEKGFSASTTSEIAKNAGVAEGTIFRYYKTKKDILHNILLHFINTFGSKLILDNVGKILDNAEDKDFRSLLKDLLYDRLKLAKSFYPIFRIVITEAIYHEDVREALYQNVALKAINIISTAQIKMADKGLIRNDISSSALLRCTLGSIFTLVAQKMLFESKTSTEEFEKEVDEVLDILLYGLVTRT